MDLMTGRMFRSGCFLQQLPHPGSIEKRTRSSAGGTPHSVASFSVLVSKWVRPSPKGHPWTSQTGIFSPAFCAHIRVIFGTVLLF